jgi:hypothetical protein
LHKILRYDMFYLWYVYFSRILVNHADAGSIGLWLHYLGLKMKTQLKEGITHISCSFIKNITWLIARFYSSAHKRVILNRHEGVSYCGEKHG